MSRVDRNNLTGIAPQKVSPLKLLNIGQPLTKGQLISLAESLIDGTDFQERMIDFKCNRKIFKRKQVSGSVVGSRWYELFLRRHSNVLKRTKGRVRDVNRHNWCTYENFEIMYENVYDAMVEAKVAVKVDHPILYDAYGNEVLDPDCADGLSTKYKLVKPENVLFVDETGKNTNQKSDGK
jgi:hypothetical protein